MTDTAQAAALDPNAIGDDYEGETELDEPVDAGEGD
jgi:hypothetical protein